MKNLIAAAKELNEAFGLKPPIKTVGIKKADLEELLIEAGKTYDPEEDELSEDTLAVLVELGAIEESEEEPEEEPEEEEPKDEEQEGDAPEEESEEEPKEAPASSLSKLGIIVDEETDLKTLKKLVKSEEVFTPLRKKVAGMFDVDDLKDAMLDLIDAAIVDKPKGKARGKAPKKEEAPKTPAKKPVPKHEGSVASYIDACMKEGGTLEEIAEKVNKKAGAMGQKMKHTPGTLKAHLKYRESKDPKFLGNLKLKDDVIS